MEGILPENSQLMGFSIYFGHPLLLQRVKYQIPYGSYLDRKDFWQNFFNSSLLKRDHVFIGGDLNFTLGDNKIWGPSAKKDPLSNFFIHKLDDVGLFDIQPIKYAPAWRKMHFGDDRVAKRLDIFLLSEPLLHGNL